MTVSLWKRMEECHDVPKDLQIPLPTFPVSLFKSDICKIFVSRTTLIIEFSKLRIVKPKSKIKCPDSETTEIKGLQQSIYLFEVI